MAKKTGELTPMMQQFYKFKQENPGALLLFRCGDFYETYCEDAEKAAKILGITLTKRSNGSSQGDAMAGFPYHALDTYLPRLVRSGCRVAICEQLEDPKKTKKLVKRGITELVTPGVAMQDNVLQTKENNFLAAVFFGKGSLGIAFLDVSTGEFMCGEGTLDYVLKLIEMFQPKEVLYDRSKQNDFFQKFPAKLCTFALDDWVFNLPHAEQKLKKQFNIKTLKGFGIDHLKNGIVAAGAIIDYLDITHHSNMGHILSLKRIDVEKYVRMDHFTIRSLELIEPIVKDGVSLLNIIDQTATAMGGRMMRNWIQFPLKDIKTIEGRQNIVEYYFRNPEFRDIVREQLQRISDLERLASKISTFRINPRELRLLMESLDAVKRLKYSCQHSDNGDLMVTAENLEPCNEIYERIKREIVTDPPLLTAKGGYIADGVDKELDDLRELNRNSKAYLLKIQQRESERTGISSLKVGYNNVFGYYLEVRNTYKDNVPEDWIRKQTLANAERYITPELKEYEQKIITAEEKILEIEYRIFSDLMNSCQDIIAKIQQNAVLVARLDCLLSFAIVSLQYKYNRPVMDNTISLNIKNGRHAVIETQMPVGEEYIPNDIFLDDKQQQIIIITGPNMAGKSALLRQTALIVILAQIGCFVPAESAQIGVVDRIFTRVGASDNIAAGESTFMVEMTEASNILNNLTDKSLVLFDELGRGTSTYDGISIAWAIVEYIHSKVKARTLFATHYHELNEMEQHFPRIHNYNVSVMETDKKVVFLRKLQKGGSEHSFGIHVASIAGMPKQIIDRAEIILKQLENENSGVGSDVAVKAIQENKPSREISFFQLDDPILKQIRDSLLSLEIDNLTPLQALNKLSEIKSILKG